MLNIFAIRATDPKVMKAIRKPIGPDNDEYLIDVCLRSSVGMVVCAWGAHGEHRERGDEVVLILSEKQVDMWCLGTTKDGEPKHPLYLAKDTEPRRLTKKVNRWGELSEVHQ